MRERRRVVEEPCWLLKQASILSYHTRPERAIEPY
jgi:hypothetical protein